MGLLHPGYCSCLLENNPPGHPSACGALLGQPEHNSLSRGNHSPLRSGTRCLCFHQFYSNVIIFTHFGEFISQEGSVLTYLKLPAKVIE